MGITELKMQYHVMPGPKYMLPTTIGFNNHDPTIKRSPAFSLGARLPSSETRGRFIPSAIAYNCSGIARNGVITVKGGALSYRKDGKIPYGPSPLSYFPDFKKLSTIRNPPSVSCASRTTPSKGTRMTPGANSYMIPHSIGKAVPHLKNAPAYSVLGRSFDRISSSVGTPHPLSYKEVKCDVYKRKPPEWSVKGRFSERRITGSTDPAPNAYFPNMTHKKNAPGFLFGVRGNAPVPKNLLDDGVEDIHIESHELDPY